MKPAALGERAPRALLLGVVLSGAVHAEHAAILDIGPGATEAQVVVLEELGRRLDETFDIRVLPPRRAIQELELGRSHVMGYVKPNTVARMQQAVRLTVPVHVSRRGLFETSAQAPDTVLLLRGFEYDPQTLALAETYGPTARVDDMDAVVRMLERGRARYAVVDEFIMANVYRRDAIRRVRTVEEVTLHFALAEQGTTSLDALNGAICAVWDDGFLFTAHRPFYPERAAFDATREGVLAEYCRDR